jgi:polyhydroxyalkanoate synthesis regulator phasin
MKLKPLCRPAVLLLALGTALPAAAQGADIDQVRAATAKLISQLVEQGVLSRDKGEALLKDVATPAATASATAPAAAGRTAATVRVPYVPEFVRKEIKDELRVELQAQAAREGWAAPGSVPAWTRGLEWDGEVRMRLQSDRYADGNAPQVSITETNRTRALTLANVSEDRTRLRVRARIGLTATIDENWAAGVRLSTGSATDPLSSNQTLGNFGNRYTVLIDRAYIRYRYADQVNVVMGRFGNPWFGTDLVWANDLSFDGVAAQWTPRINDTLRGFVTVAAMPVQEVELSSADKWLFGTQVGASMGGTPGGITSRVGLGYYHYSKLLGVPSPAGTTLNEFTAPAFAQKGNTYYNISSDPNRPLLGLAAEYQLLNLTGQVDLPALGGKRVVLSGDFVRNLGFDRAEVSQRVGTDVTPQTKGWQVRAQFGDNELRQRAQWQAFLAYKHVERDAVLDAFTDSDLRLGGTDVKGYIVGGSYALARNTAASLRWFSGDAISGAPLSIDTLQLDLNVRF